MLALSAIAIRVVNDTKLQRYSQFTLLFRKQDLCSRILEIPLFSVKNVTSQKLRTAKT